MVLVLEFLVFIISVMVHEVAHGFIAEKLGDPTARNAGRLTLNPLAHIDPFGSIILPLLLALPALVGAPTFIFGWAKPVPYNPNNLADPKTGAVKIALAGPLTNVLIALVFGGALRVVLASHMDQFILPLTIITYVNLLLAIFNLLPIPPLDGSKLLFLFLPSTPQGFRIMAMLEQYGFFLLLLFIFFAPGILSTIVQAVFGLIVGRGLGF